MMQLALPIGRQDESDTRMQRIIAASSHEVLVHLREYGVRNRVLDQKRIAQGLYRPILQNLGVIAKYGIDIGDAILGFHTGSYGFLPVLRWRLGDDWLWLVTPKLRNERGSSTCLAVRLTRLEKLSRRIVLVLEKESAREGIRWI